MESIGICPGCAQPTQPLWNFCPQCGKTLREVPLSTSVLRQVGIYAFSFLLPPFGLGIAFKYLKQPDPKARTVGIIAIILTALSIGIMFITYKLFMDSYSKLLNSFSLGY